jgi:hypothetical protein
VPHSLGHIRESRRQGLMACCSLAGSSVTSNIATLIESRRPDARQQPSLRKDLWRGRSAFGYDGCHRFPATRFSTGCGGREVARSAFRSMLVLLSTEMRSITTRFKILDTAPSN